MYAVEKAVTGNAGGAGLKRKQVKSDVSLKPAILALSKLRQEDIVLCLRIVWATLYSAIL